MSGKLAQIIEEVKSLSELERRQLKHLLDTLPSQGQELTREQQLDHLLLQRGIISRIPPPITDYRPYENRKPIEVRGKPLSETIIEERR